LVGATSADLSKEESRDQPRGSTGAATNVLLLAGLGGHIISPWTDRR